MEKRPCAVVIDGERVDWMSDRIPFGSTLNFGLIVNGAITDTLERDDLPSANPFAARGDVFIGIQIGFYPDLTWVKLTRDGFDIVGHGGVVGA